MMSPQDEINQIIETINSKYPQVIVWNVFVGKTNSGNLKSYITRVFTIDNIVYQPENLVNNPNELIKLIPYGFKNHIFISDNSILKVLDENSESELNLIFYYVPSTT